MVRDEKYSSIRGANDHLHSFSNLKYRIQYSISLNLFVLDSFLAIGLIEMMSPNNALERRLVWLDNFQCWASVLNKSSEQIIITDYFSMPAFAILLDSESAFIFSVALCW